MVEVTIADPAAVRRMLERFESETSNGREGSDEAFYVCSWVSAEEMALLRNLIRLLER